MISAEIPFENDGLPELNRSHYNRWKMRRELVSKLQAALPALGADLVFADIAAPLIEQQVLVSQEYHAILSASSDMGRCAILVDILAGKEDSTFDVFVGVLRVNHPWLADEVMEGGLGDVTDSVPIQRDIVDDQNMLNRRLELERERRSEEGCLHRKRAVSPTEQLSAHSKRVTRHHNALNSATTREVDVNGTSSSPETHQVQQAIDRRNSTFENNENSSKLTQGLTDEMMALVKKNHRTSRDWTSLAHALGLSRLVNKIRVKVLVFGEDLDFCVVHLLQEWVGERPKDATLSNLLVALRGEGFNDVADELVEKFAT